MDEMTKNALLEVVKQQTFPAIGCTEPVAVALAAATAKKYLEVNPEKIDVKVSLSIFKNGKSVTIPNTEECGLELAAALGYISGNPNDLMQVFKNINQDAIEKSHDMVKKGNVTVAPLLGTEDVYVEIHAYSKDKDVDVILSGAHTHITKVLVNGKLVFEDELTVKGMDKDFLKNLTFKELRKISEDIDIEKLQFIKEGINMNKLAAEEGLSKKNGMIWGKGLKKLVDDGKLSFDPSMKARILTSAGADFRMGGGNCPITTSGGSGNQGLGVILPITVVAEDLNISEEKLLRAIFFGHAINNFVKAYTGKLAAICGCAIGAGIGATAGIAWLIDGRDSVIEGAVNNMLANLTGLICDGAKESCSLKLSTSSAEAVIAAYMAKENIIIGPNKGIIGINVERTIKNLGRLCRDGLSAADLTMVDIIKEQ